MKLKIIIFVLILTSVHNISFAQTQKKEVDVQEISWQFSKMSYATIVFIKETIGNKDIDFLISARQHLKFAQNNLESLKGIITKESFKEAKLITDLLETILSKGLNLDMRDALALSITEKKLDNFVKDIFSNSNSN